MHEAVIVQWLAYPDNLRIYANCQEAFHVLLSVSRWRSVASGRIDRAVCIAPGCLNPRLFTTSGSLTWTCSRDSGEAKSRESNEVVFSTKRVIVVEKTGNRTSNAMRFTWMTCMAWWSPGQDAKSRTISMVWTLYQNSDVHWNARLIRTYAYYQDPNQFFNMQCRIYRFPRSRIKWVSRQSNWWL